MKKKNLILMSLAVFISVLITNVACRKDEEPESSRKTTTDTNLKSYSFSLSPTKGNIGDEEGTFCVKVSASSDLSWYVVLNNSNSIDCSISPTSGIGDGVVYIKYSARRSNASESATIIFYHKTYGNVETDDVVYLYRRNKNNTWL